MEESLFDSIKHINEHGQEYWTARELMTALEYKQWRRFENIIYRAQDACLSSGNNIHNHFADTGKMVNIGSGAQRKLPDYHLSRYACYFIAMNGDPRKKELFDSNEKDRKISVFFIVIPNQNALLSPILI